MAASLVLCLVALFHFSLLVEGAAPGFGQGACSTLQQIATESSVCSTSGNCSQIQCSVLDTTMAITLLPCASPPSIMVVLLQSGSEVYRHTFSRSEVVPVASPSGIPLLRLNVSLVVSPRQDAMTLEVTALPSQLVPLPPITLIPRTTIPLSRSTCHSAATQPPPRTPPPRTTTSSSSPSSSSSPPAHAQTCQTLQGIASGTAGQCSVVDSCTALDCNYLNQYHAKMIIKPCNVPPAIRLVVRDAFGVVVVNETLTESRTQPIQAGGVTLFTLVVDVAHTPDAIVLTVSARPPGLGDVVLIPRTPIPIDRSSCSSTPTGTGSPQSPPTVTTPLPHTHVPPSTARPVRTTCQALEQIESSVSFSCNTNVACTSILCDIRVAQLNMTVEPCLSPPGIDVKVTAVGNVLFEDSLTRSRLENVTIAGNTVLRLNVTIRHEPNALYVKIDGMPTQDIPGGGGATSYNIVPETKIPIDQCGCPGITCPPTTISTTTSFSTGTQATGGDSSSTVPPITGTGGGARTHPGTLKTTTEPSAGTGGAATAEVYTTDDGGDNTTSNAGGSTLPLKNITSTTEGSTEAVTKKQSSKVVKIVVPMSVVMVLLIVAVVVLIAVIAYFKKKQGSAAYSFQRVTFTNGEENEYD